MRPWLLLVLLLVVSCARAPVKTMEEAMRPARDLPAFSDSLSLETFKLALQRNVQALVASKNSDPMVFGAKKIPKSDYALSLRELSKHTASAEDWQRFVHDHFDVFENYGQKEWGDVFSTGYYESHVRGCHKQSTECAHAIYALPKDIVSIDLNAYAERNPDFAKFLSASYGDGPKPKNSYWRGRLVKTEAGAKILPYFDRKEIDQEQKIVDKTLILAWLDPVDAFFLQIQGSGVVDFPDGKKIRVGYAGQNGYPYVAIGKFLLDKIPLEKMSMQRIRAELKNLSAAKQQELLSQNPSYVFFKTINLSSVGTLGAELVGGRSIAVDANLFPLGALCFLQIELPNFADPKAMEEKSWELAPRFVFAQDTGGAIRGAGRADLFMGGDASAEQTAGVMKRWGKLYYLLPKDSFLAELKK